MKFLTLRNRETEEWKKEMFFFGRDLPFRFFLELAPQGISQSVQSRKQGGGATDKLSPSLSLSLWQQLRGREIGEKEELQGNTFGDILTRFHSSEQEIV